MAKGVDRLTAMQVEKAKKPGVLHDGKGLYLHVGQTGGKSWLLRYQIEGRARWMGLGPYPELKLAEAREKRDEARTLLKVGRMDPLAQRKAQQDAKKAEAAKAAAEAITFRVCAEKTIAAKRGGWRNGKHADQWTATLATYAYPVIGDLVVAAVETGHITQILEPIWTTKNETASRLRGRIENVLDFAKTHGWRTGENPARWKGHLENVLPKPSMVAKVEHHAALHWREIGAFMEKLREQEGVAARALRFAILTAARTGEVIGARSSEIDLHSAVWTVPAERMKAGRLHRVPLSEPTLALLNEVSKLAGGRRTRMSLLA